MIYDPQNIEDGVYTDMPIEVYHENNTHQSATDIKEAFKSNAHFWAHKQSVKERKLHYDFGNAFEMSIHDYSEFKKNVAIFDESERPEPNKNFGATLNKEWKADFYKDNENKLIIPINGNDSLDTLTILKKSLYDHPAAPKLLIGCEYQTTVFWTCPKTGMKLKCRPDFWKPENSKRGSIVVDLKTDRNTETDDHLKTIYNLNYPIQAVMVLEGLKAVKLINENHRFFWIVCSKDTPFNTEVYEFDSSDISAFTEALYFKLGELKRAMEKGVFLSYEPERDLGIKTVSFPYWYKTKLGITEQIDNSNI